MADSILANFAGPEIQSAAATFAKEFKRQNVFGGDSKDGGDPNESLNNKVKKSKKDELSENIKRAHQVKDSTKSEKRRQQAGELISKLEQKQAKKNKASFDDLTEGVRSAAKEFATFRTGLALLGTGAAQAANDFKAQMKFGDTANFLDQQLMSMAMGLDPAILSELQAQNRASVLAMGGVEQYSEVLAKSADKLYKYTGDNTEAARLAAASMKTLRTIGVTPTVAGLNSYADELVKVQKMTGMVMPEVGAMISRFVETDEIRSKLLSTQNKQTRQGMMLDLAKRHNLLIGMGMMTEQAEAAAKTLDALAGKGPKDRMKDAAKAQATLSGMGMGAEGAELADIMRKGIRATPDEQKRAAEILNKVQKKTSASQMGSLQGEMTQSILMQKSGLDGIAKGFGVMGDKIDPEQAIKDQTTAAEKNPQATKLLQATDKVFKAIKENAMLKLIAGSASLIVTMMAKSKLGGGGRLAGAARHGASPAAGAFGKAGMLGKSLNLFAKFAMPLTIAIAALKTFGQTTEETAASAAHLGTTWFGDGFWGTATNTIISFFHNIGETLMSLPRMLMEMVGLGDIDVKGFFVDNLSDAMSGVANFFSDDPLETKAAGNRGKVKTNKPATPRQEITPDQAEARQSDQAPSRLGKHGRKAKEKAQETRMLIQLLEQLNLNTENGVKLNGEQLAMAKEIVADGKIADDERKKMRKVMGLPPTSSNTVIQNG